MLLRRMSSGGVFGDISAGSVMVKSVKRSCFDDDEGEEVIAEFCKRAYEGARASLSIKVT